MRSRVPSDSSPRERAEIDCAPESSRLSWIRHLRDVEVVRRADRAARGRTPARIADLEVQVITGTGLERAERVRRRDGPGHEIRAAGALREAALRGGAEIAAIRADRGGEI